MKALMMITLAAVMTISAKGQDTISTKYLDMVMDGSVLTITPRKNLSSETGVRKVPYAETRLIADALTQYYADSTSRTKLFYRVGDTLSPAIDSLFVAAGAVSSTRNESNPPHTLTRYDFGRPDQNSHWLADKSMVKISIRYNSRRQVLGLTAEIPVFYLLTYYSNNIDVREGRFRGDCIINGQLQEITFDSPLDKSAWHDGMIRIELGLQESEYD